MASYLDRWLSTLPRNILAFSAIVGGIIFIILADPPHTVCDSQIELLKTQQSGFVFKEAPAPGAKKKGSTIRASFTTLYDYCQQNAGPGGCYELFAATRSLVEDLQVVPNECASDLASVSEVKKILWAMSEFMARAAWGEKPPSAYLEKFGWLDTADVALFCTIKRQIEKTYGESSWVSFTEKLFRELPGAKDLPRKEAWEKLILSDCHRY